MKTVTFSIPQPCHLHWEDLEEINTAKRSCASCNRVIHDFSKMSDSELIRFFQKNKNACGRFGSKQLDRAMPVAETSTGLRKMALLPAMLLGLAAQAKTKMPALKPLFVAPAFIAPVSTLQTDTLPHVSHSIVIEGHITDTTGAPIPFAVIRIQAAKDTSCLTDIDGNFHLVIDDPQDARIKITVAMIGYESLDAFYDVDYFKTDALGQPQNKLDYILVREEMQTYMMGDIASVSTIENRSPVRRFFHRVFHPRTWW